MSAVPSVGEKMALYAAAHGPLTANAYYRLEAPFKAAYNLGLAEYYLDGQQGSDLGDKEMRLLMAAGSDVQVYYLAANKHLNKNLRTMRNLKPVEVAKGQWETPPVIVFDADDNIEWVSPFSETFAVLGTRDFTGRVLQPGDSIRMRTQNEGEDEDIVIWEDGKSYGHKVMDIARNHQTVETAHELARMANGVTTTTEPLAEFYRDKVGCENVHVYPNSIFFPDFPDVELAEHPDEVRILWQGGIAHFEDWLPLKGVLARVSEKYPHVRWIVWGTWFKWVHGDLPPERTTILPWMPFHQYFSRLSTIGHDINLAPLVDTQFNRCKSAIKFYEAAALSHPAVTLAADVVPYRGEIQHNETGMLYKDAEEFVAMLSYLIEDATARKRMAANAKDWVHQHRDAEKNVPALLEWYQSLKRKQLFRGLHAVS